jgi:hypothetical protein
MKIRSGVKFFTLLLFSYLIIFFSATYIFDLAKKAYSQLDRKLTVSPAVVDRTVRKGDSLTFNIKVTNNRNIAKTYYIFASSFKAGTDESGNPSFSDNDQGARSVISWFEFPQKSISLRPGERKELPVKINVPANAEAGGHYGAIILSEQNPGSGQRYVVGVTEEVGTLVLLSLEGLRKEEGKVLDIKPSKYFFTELPVTINTRFENTGNVHLKPSGLIELFNVFGEKEAVLQINAGFNSVLPQSIRKYENLWDAPKYFGLFPRIGQYRAEGVVIYGSPEVTQKLAPFYFFLLPKKFILTLLGGFVIFVLIVYILLKVYKTSIIKSYHKKRK